MGTDETQVQEMVQTAERVEMPGATKVGTITHTETEDAPQQELHTLIRADGRIVYHRETGVVSIIDAHALEWQLKHKKLPDGSPAFTTVPYGQPGGPKREAFKGSLKCFLHPEHPDRKLFKEMGLGGLPFCRKSNLASPYEQKEHLKKKHKREWEAIQDMQREKKEKETEERQERQIKAMMAMAGSSKSKKK